MWYGYMRMAIPDDHRRRTIAHTRFGVDMAEQSAAKTALRYATLGLAEWIIQTLPC